MNLYSPKPSFQSHLSLSLWGILTSVGLCVFTFLAGLKKLAQAAYSNSGLMWSKAMPWTVMHAAGNSSLVLTGSFPVLCPLFFYQAQVVA